MSSLDDLINAVPGTPQTKATIALVLGAIYFTAMIAQGLTPEGSIGHKICDAIIGGLQPGSLLRILKRQPAQPEQPPAADKEKKP